VRGAIVEISAGSIYQTAPRSLLAALDPWYIATPTSESEEKNSNAAETLHTARTSGWAIAIS